MKIVVIGAGLGGLSAACLLANKGYKVTVFEKNKIPGGKVNQVKAEGFQFDTGPSLLTMPHILQHLFHQCGESLENYITLKPLQPICRYFYPDDTIFNSFQETALAEREIKRVAPNDISNYRRFLTYSKELFNLTNEAFLQNPLYELQDYTSLSLTDIFKIDALKTVAERIDSIFESSYMRQFFKRFATYNGSSPFQAPATLNVIPHVELSLGGFYVDGGIYTIIESLMQLAKKAGVKFKFNTEIERIETKDKKVTGIKTAGTFFSADLVISNSDAHETYLNLIAQNTIPLLKQKRLLKIEPSCSGFVLLLGIDKTYKQLSHHNIFFSDDYEKEFRALFNKKIMPNDPTIYIANTSSQNPTHAPPGGSNLFVLTNAPYLSNNWNWQNKEKTYRHFIIKQLENRGLDNLRNSIIYQKSITPVDFYNKYRSNKGSIYGTSSNSKMAAFLRPKNKARGIEGLYLVGGSTHPGGGIPLVIQSAFNAVKLIKRHEK